MFQPTVFISYSHQDEAEKDSLLSHLGVLQAANLIDLWSDDRIRAGADWKQDISQAMAQAEVAILLISANFLSSDFILNTEVAALLKHRERQGLVIFPVIAKPCAWTRVDWLRQMNVRPKNGRPVWGEGGSHADEDLAAIAEEVADIIDSKVRLRSTGGPARPRIFISYKRDVEPDETVALQVFEALSGEYDLFIDQMMPTGTRWAERIKAELGRSDFLITFLSAQSIHSEMVLAEIEQAHHLAGVQHGRPAILPVRLAYRAPFQYPLSEYLNPINWSFWRNPTDTQRIIDELKLAITGQDLPVTQRLKPYVIRAPRASFREPTATAQPVRLEMPEGTMDPESRFYIKREEDRKALATIRRPGVIITIKAPRQVGKSSLLLQIIAAATKLGKQVAFLDFQMFDKSALNNADLFFYQFCVWLTELLDLPNQVDDYWEPALGNVQCCTRYMRNFILKEIDRPLVLAMDEVDSVFDTDFRSDFFSMLRFWHNSRANEPIWKRLDMALVTSTEPYLLIENLNQSPFNVGEVIELPDFSLEQVIDLNHRHGSPLSPGEVQRLMDLLGGHPFLVRRALYRVASRQLSADELFAQATDDRGPFGDHLRYHLFRLHDRAELVEALRQVISHQTCPDKQIFCRLRGAGLVRQAGRAVVPRCQLYADYFREQLYG